MKLFKEIWDSITDSLGCLGALCAIIVPPLLIIGIISLFTSRCGENRHHLTPQELQAYKDSVERVESAQQERLQKEYLEHTESFFNNFSEFYPIFSGSEEFREWLLDANHSALELIHLLYNQHYHDFKGADGFDSLAEYLFWGPPEYHSYCHQCGSEVYFIEDR